MKSCYKLNIRKYIENERERLDFCPFCGKDYAHHWKEIRTDKHHMYLSTCINKDCQKTAIWAELTGSDINICINEYTLIYPVDLHVSLISANEYVNCNIKNLFIAAKTLIDNDQVTVALNLLDQAIQKINHQLHGNDGKLDFKENAFLKNLAPNNSMKVAKQMLIVINELSELLHLQEPSDEPKSQED